jgi:hypothetical protein
MVRADEPVQEGTPLNKANLLSDETSKAIFGDDADHSVENVFEKLSKATLLQSVPKFEKHTDISTLPEGAIIHLKENNSLVDFYIAKQNYESELNGNGRVLLVRKDCYNTRPWHSSDVNAYATSTIDTWLNGTYKALFDADIQTAMSTTKFYYTPGNGNTTVTTLQRAVFLLSGTELGQSHTYANTEGTALSIAKTLKIAYLNGTATAQWTRSPYTNGTAIAWYLDATGGLSNDYCSGTHGSRPAFTLPSDFSYTCYADDDGNTYDEQEYAQIITDILGNKLLDVPGVQISTGSYIGTGTYGSSNPITLTFNFEPKLLIVYPTNQGLLPHSNYGVWEKGCFLWGSKQTRTAIYSSGTQSLFVTFTVNGNTISWYSTSMNTQCNVTDTEYCYIAIG